MKVRFYEKDGETRVEAKADEFNVIDVIATDEAKERHPKEWAKFVAQQTDPAEEETPKRRHTRTKAKE